MFSKMSYEQQLINEVKDLSAADIKKIIKIVHLIKEEILERKVIRPRQNIMQYAGLLKDLTEKESKMFDEALKRKSLFGGRAVDI
ncbi:MAG: hypothetical protein MRJ65_10300 [Candidatus Brocadiaceae bacterium]|nr:hypothetical protein [Candidatus Brocadiaceae bacterium]